MPGSSSDNAVPPVKVDAGDDDGMDVDVEMNSDENIDFVGNFAVAQGLGKLEPNFDDEVSVLLLNQMGGTGRSFRRESCQAARRIVTEV